MISKLLIACFSISLLFLLNACSVSHRLSAQLSPPPDSSIAASGINLQEYIDKYKEHDAVFLDASTIYEHTGTSRSYIAASWRFYKIKKLRYLILNSDVEELTTFKLFVPRNVKVNNLYIVTMSPDKTIKKYSIDNLMVEYDSYDNKNYKISLPGIVKGSIVEYGYELYYYFAGTIPINYDVDLQYSYPCEKIEFTFSYPEWWEIETKKTSPYTRPEYSITRNEDYNKSIITYKAENVSHIADEPYSPFHYELANYLKFKVTKLDAGNYGFHSPKDWKELASNFRRYAVGNDSWFSSDVDNTTEEVIVNCTSPYEKILAIKEYIQNNIKTASDNEYRNNTEVLEDGVGDIFEICGLAQAMFEEAGLQTDYLLVHSAFNGYFDEDYISYDQFTMPAIKIEIDTTNYVVLPYFKNLPVDHLPDFIQNEIALVVSNDDNKNGEFWHLPYGKLSDNIMKDIYNITINTNGEIAVKEEKIIDGTFAITMRETISKLNEEETEEFIKEGLTYTEGDIDIKEYSIDNIDNYKEPVIFTIEYTINNLVTVTTEEIIFQTGGLFSPSSKFKDEISAEERVNPIKIYFDQIYEKDININYPEEWDLVTVLKNDETGNKFGSLSAVYELDKNKINIKQLLKLKQCSEPKESFGELLEIAGTSSALDVPALIFSSSSLSLGNK